MVLRIQSNTEAILASLYQEVEESFNRIDTQLNQLLNDKGNLVNILPSQVLSDLPKINSNTLLQFQNDNFPQQIIQQVISLIKNKNQNQNQKQKNNEQQNLKPFTYQLIQQNSYQQNEKCFIIAFNKDCSMLFAACKSEIKVLEFKLGILKQVQLLSEHTGPVFTLNFMKKSVQLISGSADLQIIIWERNQNTHGCVNTN
ncbi:unnamed protein product [Paramecium octaurelia]|uniref:WD40-repeat-containing domain n=1 Tax=Paramecium octaurelia TaxID=43137 RepID=A0A8S1SCD6_PAROT|nr:unnamed protein product [Paramecium octaurelia]